MPNQYSKSHASRKTAIANGEKFYESETPCPKCGSKEKYTVNSSCRPCSVEKGKKKLADPSLMSQYRTPEKKKKWKAKNQDRVKDIKRKHQLKKFGMTPDDYNKMLHEQEGKCKICGKGIKENQQSLAVDHCHKTNKIRGLLCGPCNRGIGLLQDNPKIIENALRYVQD